MGRNKGLTSSLLLISFLLLHPVSTHAILKDLSPAQVKEAIRYGEEHQFSEFLIDRAYEIGPTEENIRVLIATKFYQIAKAAAKAARERRKLEQEVVEDIKRSDQLEVRVQLTLQIETSPFELFFPSRSLLTPGLEFQLKQGRRVVRPSRVVPPLAGILTGGSGTYKLYFPYKEIHPTRPARLVIVDPQGEEATIKVNLAKLK